jgi:pimeloyl-ACP methyl ester carboxylesterase
MAKHEPTWILIRGLAHESGHWGEFPRTLENALGARVCPVDLPGTGEFRDVIGPASLNAIAAFVRHQIHALTRPPYHVLAISFGGMVALELMRAHPDEIAGAVLMNTSVARLSRVYNRLRWQAWAPFLRAFTLPTPRERERVIADLVINDPDQRARALNDWIRLATERPVSYRTVLNQLWAATRAGPLKPNVGRGLILSGLGDRLVDPSCSTALAGASGWPIKRHPWAGHDLAWDDAAWVIGRIRDWNP